MIENAIHTTMLVMTEPRHKELCKGVKPLWDKVYDENFKLQRSIGELAAFAGYAIAQLDLLLEHQHASGNSGHNEKALN